MICEYYYKVPVTKIAMSQRKVRKTKSKVQRRRKVLLTGDILLPFCLEPDTRSSKQIQIFREISCKL